MILDSYNKFSDDQAITATAASTNVIDLGAQDSKVKVPNKRTTANIFAEVTTAFNNLTSLKVALQSSTDEGFSSPVEHQSVTVALASLVAGKRFALGQMPEGLNRYVRLYYTVTGTAPTAGKVWAGLTMDEPIV